MSNKIIRKMAEYIYDTLGTCPEDEGLRHKIDCMNACDTREGFAVGCWIHYFKYAVDDE